MNKTIKPYPADRPKSKSHRPVLIAALASGLLLALSGAAAAQPAPSAHAPPPGAPTAALLASPLAVPSPLAGPAAMAAMAAAPAVGGIPGTWLDQGPGPTRNGQVQNLGLNNEVTGNVHAVVAHPTDADTIYVGAVNGGVWRTSDATSAAPNWTPLTDFERSLSIGALEMDPGNTSILLAGIGRFSSFGGDPPFQIAGGPLNGLLYTTDAGASWIAITDPLLVGEHISAVAARGATLLAGANNFFGGGGGGLFRSTDTGATWAQIDGGPGIGLPFGSVDDMAGDPASASRLYVALEGNGIYVSNNTGATWTQVSNNNANLNTAMLASTNTRIAVGPTGRVYVLVANSNGGIVSFIGYSDDNGTTWTEMDIPGTVETPLSPRDQLLGLTVDPNDADIVYASGITQRGGFPNSIGATSFHAHIFRGDASRVRGLTGNVSNQWDHITHDATALVPNGGTANTSAPHADSRELVFDAGGDLIEVNDGGINRRTSPTDNTGDWFPLNGDLQITEFHSIAYDTNFDLIFGGTQDTGTAEQLASGSTTYDSISVADGGKVAWADLGGGFSRRYSSFQNLNGFTRRDCTPVCATFNPALTGRNGAQFYTPVETHATDPTRLLLGTTFGPSESMDSGANAPPVAGSAVTANSDARMVYGHASDSELIYLGAGSGVFVRTTASGALGPTAGAFPGGTVQGVAVDPADPNRVFVIDNSSVYQSVDGGTTWTDISGNVTADGAGTFRSIAYMSGAGVDDLVVGTDKGILISPIGAPAGLGSWFQLGTNLPNAVVWDMVYDPVDDVLVAGTLGRSAWSFEDASMATNALAIETDLVISKVDDVDPVIAGNVLTYTITVENQGQFSGLDVIVTDTIPAGEDFLDFAGTDPTVWDCSHVNGIVTCNFIGGMPSGTLVPGAIETITMRVTVLPETRDDTINNANVVSSTADPQQANNFTEEDTEVIARADLSITKSGSPFPILAGNNLTYSITATNNGPSSADNMQIVDPVPAHTTFVSATPSAGGACVTPTLGGTGTVTCTWGGMTPPGGIRTLTMVVNVNPGTLAGTVIQNTATTNSTTTDPNSANNSQTDNKPITTQAVVQVTKTDNPFDPVVAGQDDIFYKITVTNTGPSDAQNVVATDTLPAGVTFVSTTGCGEDPNVAIGGVFTCTIGTVTAGSSVVIVVRVSVDPMTVGLITNTVDVTWDDSSPGDNMAQATEDTTVLSVADVSITKTDDPDPVLAGALLTYTVTVTNAGPSDAQSVDVTDTLPAEVTFQSSTGCLNDPNGVPVCMLGTVPAGATVNYTIEVLVDANAPDGTITNTVTAAVGGGSTDPDLSNNTASEDTVIMRLLAASQPGSALIFPLFDVNDGSGSRDAKSSTFKLTNLGQFSDVTVHLVRVCGGVKGFGGKGLCQASDRTLTLTPGETAIRDVASFFNIDRSLCPSGYIVAYAQGPNGVPIVYDRLTGSMHINGAGPLNQRTTALTAIAVQAAGGQVEGDPVIGALGGTFPELPFDGLGYRALPERLQTDFLATTGTRHSELVLLTLDIKAGAQNLPTLVALDWTNQDEVPFSGALEYVCHVYVRLDDEVNPEQPGAGVQGGGGFRASGLGSAYGLLEIESSGSDAVLGALLEQGQNRLTLRHLLHPRDGAKTTIFIGR